MGTRRLLAIATPALWLVGCYSIPFEYARLTSENVEVAETGRGPIGHRPWGGERIPYSYVLEEPGVSLSLTMRQWLGPNFDLVSSVPIRWVSVDNGFAGARSAFDYNVSWGMADPDYSRAGEPIRMRVALEGRTDPIVISGVIAESGELRQLCLWACPDVAGRPQVPRRPFPYSDEQVVFRNEVAGIALAGTLTVPRSSGPFAAVVLVAPHDRDVTTAGHKPFLVLADYLTRQGFAVLRFDRRGVGGSEPGPPGPPGATGADVARDVLAAVSFLQGRAEIDPERIGLVGYEGGGLFAALAAAMSEDTAFIVMLAAPGTARGQVDPRAILVHVRPPVLALIGAHDVVVPAQPNLAAIEAALREGGNADSTVRELPELNHLFQTSATGAIAEYADIEETFDPDALALIGDWILARVP